MFVKEGPSSVEIGKVICAEWACVLGMLQALYPRGKLDESAAEILAGVNPNQLARSGGTPSDLASEVDAHFARLLALASEPFNLNTCHKAKAIEAGIESGPMAKHPLRSLLLQNMEGFFLEQLRTLAAYRVTALTLLLREYYLMHGAWPDALSQVITAQTSELAIDPFSENGFFYLNPNGHPRLYSEGIQDIAKHGPVPQWRPNR